jgi:predicted O-methyltransferase YrrM
VNDALRHDLVARVQRARRRLAESGPAAVRAEGDLDRVALPHDDGDALRDVLLAEHARVVIEIGLAYGASALAIAEALVTDGHGHARHVIIDPFQDHFHEVGWNALTDAGLTDVCTLLRERSELALPQLLADLFVADAAFVDGSHHFHRVFVDLCFLRELVRPGGLVVLDDCEWPSVATAVRYFEVNAGWHAVPINDRSRLRAYRLPDPRFEPPFESFRAFDPGP